MLWRLGLLLLGIGAFLKGWDERTLSRVAKQEAQVLTCAQLEAKGPGDNAHVAMTDFVLTPAYVVEEGKRKKDWKKVWAPAVPIDSAYAREAIASLAHDPSAKIGPPKDLRVIVLMTEARDEDGVAKVGLRPQIEGLVINAVEKLPDDATRILEQSYPGVDLGKCWILQADRSPPSAGTYLAWFGGGLLLFGAGLLAWRRWWRARRAAREAPAAP